MPAATERTNPSHRKEHVEHAVTGQTAGVPEIVVVDDDDGIRDMLALYLRSQGYAVAAFSQGPRALDRCRAQLPALVLSDLRMPGMDGLELLAALRALAPELPVIVVSGTGEMSDAIQALKLGAADYITKPIEDFAVLDHAVGRVLERARLLAENAAYRAHLETVNARLADSLRQLEADEALARQIQFAMMPERNVSFGPFECSRSVATSAFLSGDFIDYFAIDDTHFGFYMADVSGHGVSSAVITVLLKSYVGRYQDDYRRLGDRTILNPAALLSALNRLLLAGRHGKYLTMFYGVAETASGRLAFANGGQFPFPLLYDGKSLQEIGGRSQPVGLFAGASYQNQQIVLPKSCALHVFSDGVLELLDAGALPARKAALQAIAATLTMDAGQLAAAHGLGGDRNLPDDASILSIRRVNSHG